MNNIWTEKYRPDKVDNIIGQQHIITDLKSFVEKKEIPHLLFYGCAGIGKTTTAIALAKELLGDYFHINFLELNASDSRKIEHVRDIIKNYARQSPMEAKFKIILLDEVDSMTPAAQMALKRIMEKYSNTCRFILTCNHIQKLDDAIISRCANYNFLPITINDIADRLASICDNEEIKHNADATLHIAKTCSGDVRRAVIKLQSVASKGEVNMESLMNDKVEGNFLFLIKTLFKDKDFISSRQAFVKLQHEGLTIREIIGRIHFFIMDKGESYLKVVKLLRNADMNLLYGVNQQLEIDVLIMEIISL